MIAKKPIKKTLAKRKVKKVIKSKQRKKVMLTIFYNDFQRKVDDESYHPSKLDQELYEEDQEDLKEFQKLENDFNPLKTSLFSKGKKNKHAKKQ